MTTSGLSLLNGDDRDHEASVNIWRRDENENKPEAKRICIGTCFVGQDAIELFMAVLEINGHTNYKYLCYIVLLGKVILHLY